MLKSFSSLTSHPVGMHGSTLSQQAGQLPSLDLRPDRLWKKPLACPSTLKQLQSVPQQCHNHLAKIHQCWKLESDQICYGYRNRGQERNNPLSKVMYWFYYPALTQTGKSTSKLPLTESVFFQSSHHSYGSTLTISKENKSTRLKCFCSY